MDDVYCLSKNLGGSGGTNTTWPEFFVIFSFFLNVSYADFNPSWSNSAKFILSWTSGFSFHTTNSLNLAIDIDNSFSCLFITHNICQSFFPNRYWILSRVANSLGGVPGCVTTSSLGGVPGCGNCVSGTIPTSRIFRRFVSSRSMSRRRRFSSNIFELPFWPYCWNMIFSVWGVGMGTSGVGVVVLAGVGVEWLRGRWA